LATPFNPNGNRNNFYRRSPQKKQNPHRINNEIRDVHHVRVVGDNTPNDIISFRDALALAENMGLDLVEISPAATPPVVKIMDYQKFLYQLKQKEKERKANSAKITVKEIRLTPQTDQHDFDFKLNHAIKFLKEGNKVKVDVFFKGRMIAYKEQGEKVLYEFANALLEYGKPEANPKLEGKRLLIVIAPKK
jgi:translation initiation factor IF-3